MEVPASRLPALSYTAANCITTPKQLLKPRKVNIGHIHFFTTSIHFRIGPF